MVANLPPESSPLRSVHTNSFPALLKHLGISLVVSTYQAGKLIILREDAGVLNTHFRVFKKPMGLAVNRERLAIGTAYQIWELRNVPAVAQKLEPPNKHDACYLPRQVHISGDIDIHEMAFAREELWFVNTRFSCLCTLDGEHSFVPRWRPPFVSAYELSDRCHLNGLGMRDDRPRYITALGETDTPGGWRQNKANGGILMDITSNEILCRGLSMPHSPRWYGDRLWVLESGRGSIAAVDRMSGKWQAIAQLPGFTRGIDFWGEWAFIGLSQIRETAVFSGLPITETLKERVCGVWAVNLRTGEIAGFVRFEEGVQEIFAVQVMPGFRYPEVIDWDERLMGSSYVLPDEALKEVIIPPPEDEATRQERERNSPEFQLELGNQAYHNGDRETARLHYERCLELNSDFLVARYNLGVVFLEMERWQEADGYLQQVIDIDPRHPDAYNNLGIVYHRQNRLSEAIGYFQRAIALRSHFPDAHFNLGMTLLQAGEFPSGFAESEWRWQTKQFTPFNCPHPRWDGSEIQDKTLLIHTEQGAGDAIQFIRYVPMVARRCRRLLLCCTENLVSLFATVDGIDEILTPGEIPLSAFDTFTPLMSLPHLLGTTLETVPNQVPYLGRGLVGGEIDFPSAPPGNQKIGIVWAGSPTHKNDRNRSCRLEDFLPLLELAGCTFYSLQKGQREEDIEQLPPEFKIIDLSSQLKDYAATTRAILNLDLVISVDTSVAHLAGALAKPVWTLLCFSPDWRWMLDRNDSPWYATMRLFRQPTPGDWKSVFAEVEAALKQKI